VRDAGRSDAVDHPRRSCRAGPTRQLTGPARLPGVLKKLIILAILVALGTIAAKKVRAV
jgi:hypothetical protein